MEKGQQHRTGGHESPMLRPTAAFSQKQIAGSGEDAVETTLLALTILDPTSRNWSILIFWQGGEHTWNY